MEDIIGPTVERLKSREYQIKKARAKGDIVKATGLEKMTPEDLDYWFGDVQELGTKLSKISGGEIGEKTRAWARNNLKTYLQAMHWLATLSRSEKIKFEALKYLISLAGVEEKKDESKLTAIERYITQDGREITKSIERKHA
jgi:hypothetical protein